MTRNEVITELNKRALAFLNGDERQVPRHLVCAAYEDASALVNQIEESTRVQELEQLARDNAATLERARADLNAAFIEIATLKAAAAQGDR